MATEALTDAVVLGRDYSGLLMTPEEFDAVAEYDENYHYELVNGVVVVQPIPGAIETGPNELLGYYLLSYKSTHPQGAALSDTLPQQYVRTKDSRRLADRLIWTGLGRLADTAVDLPTIAIELVSAGKRNAQRDYVDKRHEYMEAGIREYWIIDRFRRTLTVVRNGRKADQIVPENDSYRTPLLPGFELPLAQILIAAEARVRRKK